jgi:transposase
MRKGMQGLALQVQQGLGRNPHGGDLFVFRGRAGALIKIIWPSAKDGIVSLTPAQLACLLEGIDWRNPQHTARPTSAG